MWWKEGRCLWLTPGMSSLQNLASSDRRMKVCAFAHRVSDLETCEIYESFSKLVLALRNASYHDIQVVHSYDEAFWSCLPCQFDVHLLAWCDHNEYTLHASWDACVEIASSGRPEGPLDSNAEQRAYLLGQHFYHYYWQEKGVDEYDMDIDLFASELKNFAPPSSQPELYKSEHDG